jgi:hypothetical protein
MSDFSFSYSVDSYNPNASAAETLWSFNSVQIIPCTSDTVLLKHSHSDQGILVRPEVARALSLCNPFKSLAGHHAQILEAMPPLRETPEDVTNILTSVQEAGFFESNTAAWQRLAQTPGSSEAAPARLFILTCDRPEALQRLLDNLKGITLDQSIESLWIVDDSKLDLSGDKNAEIIEAFRGRLNLPVYHICKGMQERLSAHLIRELPQHQSSVSFLIDKDGWPGLPTYGRARNLALLLSVGCRALVLDDDILLQAVAPPLALKKLSLGNSGAREARFYDSHNSLMQHALNMADDPLTLMLSNVGRSLGELVCRVLSSPSDLAGWDGELLSKYTSDSPVLINQCGTWGDPGTSDGSWIFFLPPSSIKELTSDQHSLASLLSQRSCWFGYRGPTLTSFGIMAAVTGLDHRSLLPPYFPAGRGEDILFGIMTQRLHPQSLALSEGWAVRHDPIESRPERGNLNPVSVSPGLSNLADWLGREPEDQQGLTPERRMNILGNELASLCEMSADAMERLVRSQLASKRAELLARCIDHISQLNAQESSENLNTWSDFLQQTQAGLIDSLQTPETEPVSVALSKNGSANFSSLKKLGQGFADALSAWPEICQAARSFKPKQ